MGEPLQAGCGLAGASSHGVPDTGRTWGCDLAPGLRLTAPPLTSPTQHQLKVCHCEGGDDPYPRAEPVCSCPCSAHRSAWHGVGTRFGVAECQRPRERTRTACAGGRGHAQPWDREPGLSAPSFLSPVPPSADHRGQGGICCQVQSIARTFRVGSHMCGVDPVTEINIVKASVSRNVTWSHRSPLRSVHSAHLRAGSGSSPRQGTVARKEDALVPLGVIVRSNMFSSPGKLKSQVKGSPDWREDRSGCYFFFSSSLCPEIAQIYGTQHLSAPPKLRWPEGTLASVPQAGKVLTGRHFLSTRGLWPLRWAAQELSCQPVAWSPTHTLTARTEKLQCLKCELEMLLDAPRRPDRAQSLPCT